MLAGTAGVGKTALAVRWARRAAAAFPDGQLYVNLRGYDPGAAGAPGDALAGFLRALGVAGEDIPAGEDERAAAYRSLLDGRRMLVVLDNAASVEQVRPLLPGSPTCLVVVTSRDSMAGLVARHGARRLALDMLPAADAIGLLRTLIGDRVDAEPGAAAELAGQCARLPLALRVAAELAAASPDSRLAELAGELAGEQRRLDLLDAGGDERTAVRGVFSWSYRHLPAAAARAFRLIGLHPGPDLDAYAVAALTGATGATGGHGGAAVTATQAKDALALLARAHLVHPVGAGRYGLHDLLRAYARELAAAEDGADEPASRVDQPVRLLPGRRRQRHGRPRPGRTALPAPPRAHRHARRPTLAAAAQARGWLDAERAGLVAVAAAHRRPGLAGSHHPARRHPVPVPGDRRPLRRRGDRARPLEPRGPPAWRPRRRGDGADQPRHHQLAAGPLPAGGRLPSAVAGRFGRDRRPPGRGQRARPTSAPSTNDEAATSRPHTATSRP